MSDSIVIRTKIKELAETFSVSSDFAEVLDKKVKDMVEEAKRRAEANGRRTIMSKDL
jgi:histone H3/H4